MDCENTIQKSKKNLKPETYIKTLKIILKPNELQKNILNQWFDVFRYFYNITNEFVKKYKIFNFRKVRNILRKLNYIPLFNYNNKLTGYKFTTKQIPNKFIVKNKKIKNNIVKYKKIKNNIVKYKKIKNTTDLRKFNLPEWVNENIPPRIITGAINDCCKSYKTCFTLLKTKQINKFDIKYKSKKKDNILSLEKSCFGVNNHLLPRFIKEPINGCYCIKNKVRKNKKYKINRRHKIELKKIKITKDCRLNLVNGKYILYVPVNDIKKVNNNTNEIALDSGIRTFQTGYSTNNVVINYGTNIETKINYLFEKTNKLQRYYSKTKNPKLLVKIKRTNLTLRNKISDLHWQIINELVKTHKNIILGDFKTQEILRKLSSRNNRLLNIMRHYDFKDKLKYKCDVNNCNLYIVNESYTSKTCSNCGILNNTLGISKVFNCGCCKKTIDRDANGAMNILIKHKMKLSVKLK
jgi:IS605 OrfB family transposase